MNMLSRSASLTLLAGVVSVFQAVADPVLPFQKPIEQRLTNEIALGIGNQTTLNKALDAYQKKSKALSGDTTILNNLNNLLDTTTGYPPLISDAATTYLSYFQVQRDELYNQLRPAPLSSTRTSAVKKLAKLDNVLSNAVLATTISKQISDLQSAAQKIPDASNTIRMALKQPIRLSSMTAMIGALKFKSSSGYVSGGTNFATGEGAMVGDFAPVTGTLTFSAIAKGNYTRGITLHVEGISLLAGLTYPLGIGENSAFYDVTDLTSKNEYHFQCRSTFTNSVVTNSWLSIDYVGTNYLLGRFAFLGTNSIGPTNTSFVTVSEGNFQLNYH